MPAKNFYLISLALAVLATPFAFIFNNEIFFALNCRRDSTALNWFFLTLTSLADGLWVVMVVLIVQSLRPRSLATFILALLIGNVILQSGKYFIDLDRPLRLLGAAKVCVLGLPVTLRSFPSGHSFSALLLLMYLRPRHIGAAAGVTLFCVLAAISRIYVGAHFPRDVVTGGLIAVMAYFAAESLLPRLPQSNQGTFIRKGILTVAGSGTALIYIFAYTEKTPELTFLLTPLACMVVLYWVIYALLNLRPRQTTTR